MINGIIQERRCHITIIIPYRTWILHLKWGLIKFASRGDEKYLSFYVRWMYTKWRYAYKSRILFPQKIQFHPERCIEYFRYFPIFIAPNKRETRKRRCQKRSRMISRHSITRTIVWNYCNFMAELSVANWKRRREIAWGLISVLV